MRILTLNCWGNHGPLERIPLLQEAILSLQPDILCLQETPEDPFFPKLASSLKHPTRVNAPDSWLAVSSRFPVRQHRIESYRTLSPLEPYRRQALGVELALGINSLWVVTTHLAWKAEDEATRLKQADELIRLVEPLGGRVFLAGDFNAKPQRDSIRRVRQQGFADLFARLHPEKPGITWDNSNPFIQSHSVRFPDRRIDYLFLKEAAFPQIQLVSCEVAGRTPNAKGLFPSDHYGLLADLNLKA